MNKPLPIAFVSLISICGLLLLTCLIARPLIAQDEVSFTRDIRPLLSDKCFHCHGNDENALEAGLRLDIRESAIELGAIVPGEPDESTAYQKIVSDDEDERMPPLHSHKSLSKNEKDLIGRWIAEGAVYQQHWAYRNLEAPTPPEQGIQPNQDNYSVIDALITKRLHEKNLTLSKVADRTTLARRLHLDLTGLPPTSKAIEEFLGDDSENAYEKLVDRLLKRPAYGERMATFWLDLVRYADTIGYHTDNSMEVSAYRDYVIKSFNDNKPFDQFTIEQLAGDLLPNPTQEQKVASGYNRLLQTTEEGGAQPKEYIAIYAADRVRNVSGVWLGQTMGCAQCHDHKYDPITAKDFYAMSAFFADIKETAVGKQESNLTIYSDEERSQLDSLQQSLASAEKASKEFTNDERRGAKQHDWESGLLADDARTKSSWQIPEVTEMKHSKKAELTMLGDGSLLNTGEILNKSTYEITVRIPSGISTIPSLRLEALTDTSFPLKGSFSRGNGNFVLTGFQVGIGGQLVKIKEAKADFAQNDWPASDTLDDKPQTGWAVSGHSETVGRRVIIFTFEKPIDVAEVKNRELIITLKHNSVHAKHNIDRFRLSLANVSPDDPSDFGFDGPTGIPEVAISAIKTLESARTPEQQAIVDDCYFQYSDEAQANRQLVAKLSAKIESMETNAQTTLISESMVPRETKVRNRGDWMDESGEVVQPSVPSFLPWTNKVEGRRAIRLDLAKWILEPTNPLTARTFVNRIWNVYFGRGISKNLDDLGGQGQPPTHPELLDWLAVEFRDGGWDVKRTVKMILMSEAYRQSSFVNADSESLDPGNQLFSRQGRWRIDAEFVRDTALQLSGLLVSEQIGGKSVKPYQPAGYWQHLNFPKRTWQDDSGNNLYRRSLYTFWCRTFLHPSMVAFDAPSREECIASRARSNIPQQALVLLNDPIFVETSRGFAQRMMAFEGPPEDRIKRAWKEAVSRDPTGAEVTLLVELYKSQKQKFANAKLDAIDLTTVGESPLPDGMDRQELAAWMQVARAMLNAYETISRY